MTWNIGMPNLGHTMEEGKVGEWLKKVGDAVTRDEVIAIIETDKASFDVEAPADGILLAIAVPAGTVVAVGTIIGVVGAPGDAVSAPVAPPQRAAASPAARSLAAELGVDIAAVRGTGEDGIVTRDDVREAAQAGPQVRMTKFTPMRRAIADATAAAWRTIPHVTLVRSVDVGRLLQARQAGLTAAVVHATAQALSRHGQFNGWLKTDAFHQGPAIDIGVAVASEGGLMMPVIRRADSLDVAGIGREIALLAASARGGSLGGGQTLDATFSVSSLGRWGVDFFTPVINAPQVAILGVGRVDRVAREAPDGSVRFASEVRLSLVFDHRANDGVAAAELLADIAATLERA